MATAIDVANFTKPEIVPVYKYEAEIDITPQAPTRTWAKMCAGFNNISEAMNETIQQYFFLCGKGFGANYVTGIAPSMTFAGVRVIGDAAQDYMFAQKYELMSKRDSHFRLTRTSDNGTKSVISANVTFANMSDVSGGTTDGSAISVEMRFNGAPFLGDAWADAPTSCVIEQHLYNVTNSNGADSVVKGQAYSGTLTADAGYQISSVVIAMDGEDITATAYNTSTGEISISEVTGQITINAFAAALQAFSITQTLTKVTSTNTATSTYQGASYTTTLAAESTYTLDSVAVTMGGTDITATAYDDTTDVVSIASVSGDIVITATAV